MCWNWAAGADFDPGMTPLFNIPAPGHQLGLHGGAALGQADATMVRVVIECVSIGRADAMLEAQVRPTTTGENYRTSEVVARPGAQHHRARRHEERRNVGLARALDRGGSSRARGPTAAA